MYLEFPNLLQHIIFVKSHEPKLGTIFKEGISIRYETSFYIKSEGQISFDPYVRLLENFNKWKVVCKPNLACVWGFKLMCELLCLCVNFVLWFLLLNVNFHAHLWTSINVLILLSNVNCCKRKVGIKCLEEKTCV